MPPQAKTNGKLKDDTTQPGQAVSTRHSAFYLSLVTPRITTVMVTPPCIDVTVGSAYCDALTALAFAPDVDYSEAGDARPFYRRAPSHYGSRVPWKMPEAVLAAGVNVPSFECSCLLIIDSSLQTELLNVAIRCLPSASYSSSVFCSPIRTVSHA